MKKHLLIALLISIAIGGTSFVPTTNSAYANTYQTQNITKQDVADMINLGADFGFEGVQNMNNGDTEKAYQNFNKALQYLGKAENYLNQTTEVFDKEKYRNSITTTKASILSTMERIKNKPVSTNSSQDFKQSYNNSQDATYSVYYNNFSKNSEIGMKYANKCLDYRASGNHEEVIKNADLAIKYLNTAMVNLKKDTDKRLSSKKQSALKDCKDVLVILYCEKAKAEIEHTNQVTTGRSDLNSALKLNPDEAAKLILGFAKTAISQSNYEPAIVYIETVSNNSSISTTHKSTAKELSSQIPKYEKTFSKVDKVFEVLDAVDSLFSN